jgi:hypothetical protein
MKTTLKTGKVIVYGRLADRIQASAASGIRHSRMPKWNQSHDLFIALSDELDEGFAQFFRERATKETRLLVLNTLQASDRLVSFFVNLQIRSPRRFYVVDLPTEHTSEQRREWIHNYLGRLFAVSDPKQDECRILDARLSDEILHVVSTNFQRLEVPVSEIGSLAKAERKSVERLEIDEDGSYVYWPELDIHLGWEQFQQVVDPAAVQRAKQKSHEFNVRYGAAIRKVREEKELSMSSIPDLSSKQLRRIERGESRLTSSTAEKLAKGHGMTPNEYLQAVAKALR